MLPVALVLRPNLDFVTANFHFVNDPLRLLTFFSQVVRDLILVYQTEIPPKAFDENVERRLLTRRRTELRQSRIFNCDVVEKVELMLLRSLLGVLFIFIVRFLKSSPARKKDLKGCLSRRSFGLLLARAVPGPVLYFRCGKDKIFNARTEFVIN